MHMQLQDTESCTMLLRPGSGIVSDLDQLFKDTGKRSLSAVMAPITLDTAAFLGLCCNARRSMDSSVLPMGA